MKDENNIFLKEYIIIYFFIFEKYYILQTNLASREGLIYYDKYYYLDDDDIICSGFSELGEGHYSNYDKDLKIVYQSDTEDDAIYRLNLILKSNRYNL